MANFLFVLFPLITLWFTHRVGLILYRLYFHPLARFPGPRLAASSTIYRSFFQVWRDGKLIEHLTVLHDVYGPVVRISPNELHFRNVAAYHDIYSARFDGAKDPDYYEHLGQSTALFGLVDPNEHRMRFRLVSHLFSKSHFDWFEPRLQAHVARFGYLLSVSARRKEICNLSFGFRSLAIDIVNEFIFGELPSGFRQLKDKDFVEPLALGTHYAMNWWIWLSRNFPTISNFCHMLPSASGLLITEVFDAPKTVVRLVTEMVRHALVSEPSDWHNSFFYCIARGLGTRNTETRKGTSLNGILVEEVMGTMLGGVIDIANILPYGAFHVSRNSALQDLLFDELQAAWTDINDPIPPYETLSQLPILNGVVKESLRLTHGVISGPPRLVGYSGAVVDGYRVPAGCVVTTTSLYVHMDSNMFPKPEDFDPCRWQSPNARQMENAIVGFSKGRRMCPARQMAYTELFSTFATLFRRFHVTPYETNICDFEYSEYLSLHFRGRPLRVTLWERTI